MFHRSRLLAVLTVGSAAALFRRKGGSLGELPPPPDGAVDVPDGDEVVTSEAASEAVPHIERTPLEPLDAPAMASRAAVEPAPHPIRPHEMWHPGIVPSPDDELLAEAEALREERRREEEARTAPAAPVEGPLIAVPPPRSVSVFDEPPPAGPPPIAFEPPSAGLPPIGFESPASDRPPTAFDQAPAAVGAPAPALGEAAPFVPPASTIGGSGLIAGPVARRGSADRSSRPSLLPRIGQAPLEADPPAAPVPATLPPPILAVPPTVVSAEAPVLAEPEAPEVHRSVPDVIVGGDRVAARPAPTAPALPSRDEVVDVVQLPLRQGSLRVSRGAGSAACDDGELVRVPLHAGWCWAALPADLAQTVVVDLAVGQLTVPADTTALVTVDADGTVFVVIVTGEAVLQQPSGRMRLRSGALVLSVPGGDIQADVADAREIAADPLVRLNLHLDDQA